MQFGIAEEFSGKLKGFAQDGYRFDHKNELRPGTQREAFDSFIEEFGKHFSVTGGGAQRVQNIVTLGRESQVLEEKEGDDQGFYYQGRYLGTTHQQVAKYLLDYPELTEIIVKDIETRRIGDGYFEIPTGVGKTVLFLALIRNFMNAAREAQKPPRTLIVVPSKKLVEQTALRFAKFMPDVAKLVEQTAEDDTQEMDYEEEIDYKKSDIGIHYSTRKISDKPIVITTYQSLLMDLRRPADQRVFKPEDFGLTVFDEGHMLTGAQFSNTARAFKDHSIRIAFTATPHYSEQKTLAQQLPHCYFRISTGKCMSEERKDLCMVRPVLVRTHFEIDRSKLETAINKYGERQYKRAQLEKMLNVAARNEAAVTTYLSYRDPDTQELLFGQRGLAFCVGREHSRNMAIQFNASLDIKQEEEDKPEDKPDIKQHKAEIRQRKAEARALLEENNITLAAYVGGDLHPDELKRIYRLHEQGKILILCSAELLKTGYDAPQDSFCMNLADTLSVVDAKQRNGRSFRLSEDDPDKFATNFDFIDDEVYEKNQKNRQLLPIFCEEILGEDFEFRKPTKRKGIIRGVISGLATPVLVESRFEAISDYEHVHRLSRERKKEREEAEVPTLPEDKKHWVTGKAGCTRIGIDASPENIGHLNTELQAILQKELEYEGEDKESLRVIPKVNEDGKSEMALPSKVIGKFFNSRNPDGSSYYFDPVVKDYVRKRLGLARPVPLEKKHWVTGKAGCAKIQIDRALSKRLNATLQAILQKELEYEGEDKESLRVIPKVSDDEKKEMVLPSEVIEFFSSESGTNSYYFDPAIAGYVRQYLNLAPLLPKAKEHWVTGARGCRVIQVGATPENVRLLSAALKDILQAGFEGVGSFFNNRSPDGAGYYFDPAAKAYVRQVFDTAKEMQPTPFLPKENRHWVMGAEGCGVIQVKPTPENIKLLNTVLQGILQEGRIEGVGNYPSARYPDGSHYFDPAIKNYVRELFQAAKKRERTSEGRESLKKERPKPRPSPAHQTSEEREEEKRGDKGR